MFSRLVFYIGVLDERFHFRFRHEVARLGHLGTKATRKTVAEVLVERQIDPSEPQSVPAIEVFVVVASDIVGIAEQESAYLGVLGSSRGDTQY